MRSRFTATSVLSMTDALSGAEVLSMGKAMLLKHLIKPQIFWSDGRWGMSSGVFQCLMSLLSTPDKSPCPLYLSSKQEPIFTPGRGTAQIQRTFNTSLFGLSASVQTAPSGAHTSNRVQLSQDKGLTPWVKNTGKAPERFPQLLRAI